MRVRGTEQVSNSPDVRRFVRAQEIAAVQRGGADIGETSGDVTRLRPSLLIERGIEVPLNIATVIPVGSAVPDEINESFHCRYNRFSREPCGVSSTV